MGKVTHGDVLRGAARAEDLVPFGGEQAHKAFALAVGLQAVVGALVGGESYGAVLLVARPEADPVPALRATVCAYPVIAETSALIGSRSASPPTTCAHGRGRARTRAGTRRARRRGRPRACGSTARL